MTYRILAINPGSTSTKVAVYEDQQEIICKSLDHPVEEIEQFEHVQDQFDMRSQVIAAFLKENGIEASTLSAVVGRGGILPPVKSGAYAVNDLMVDRLKNRPVLEHASNLGPLIAYEMATSIGKPAYIYDSVSVDELGDLARLSGIPELPRASFCHALNSRAMAMKVAEKMGSKYSEKNFVVAHLGGGASVSVHEKGKMVDILADDEGTFSPERSGRVPCVDLVKLCFSGKYSQKEVLKKLRGGGGIKAYLGTVDVREVERRIEVGDKEAGLVLEAFAYQTAKGIAELSSVVCGKVDAIILTGGIAYSKRMVDWISERVSFIAPIQVMPGENEMEALAFGALRVLKGEEEAKVYTE